VSAKHRLKLALREVYARLLFHTGLHRAAERLAPKRLTILAGHCVTPEDERTWSGGRHLPPDMKISTRKLRAILDWFAQRNYPLVAIGEGAQALERGKLERSLVALSFDDGYRDNHRVLLPLLRELGARATVFLETGALDQRRVYWSHKYFWLTARLSALQVAREYLELAKDEGSARTIGSLVAGGERVDLSYQVKRALKYEVDPAARDRALDQLFARHGGDERALCEELYMNWEEAGELQRSGVELGGHTVSHAVLSRRSPAEQESEVREGAEAIERATGVRPQTFAYPFGRRWDFDERSERAVERSGFARAVTMHAGTNLPHTPRTRMHRLALDESSSLHLLVAEACGGFDLLKKLGLNLSE
jgi:peptidoglycan/xylan/chitin deacetylase (PgdA/CDA1 family)